MQVFRLFREGRRPDDSYGARLFGGRWNPEGVSVLYTSSHLSLACLETLVHVSAPSLPPMLFARTDVGPVEASLDPTGHQLARGLAHTRRLGLRWLEANDNLAIRVPSILIPHEDNVLLNPAHPNYQALAWEVYPFDWDRRILELLNSSR